MLLRVVMRSRILAAVAPALLCAVAGMPFAAAQERSGQPPRTVVLDTFGIWRMHETLKPPVIDLGQEKKLIHIGAPYLDRETPPPASDWAGPDFDDSHWLRGPARRFSLTPFLARLCVRGKFTVTDPARVQGLNLTVDFFGGAVVRVNGKELGRAGLPAGADGATALADGYPPEAYLEEDGKWLWEPPAWSPPKGEQARRLNLRTRRIVLPIPREALRAGLNVIAVDIVRAPYHRIVEEKKQRGRYALCMNTCELRGARLTAAAADGLVPNAVRPKGLQVWNADPLAGDVDVDFGDRTEPLRPVALTGVRNGHFTGKVIIGRDQPIRDLKATPADLRSDGGAVIPAAQVACWYGLPWGSEAISNRYAREFRSYPQGATFLNALSPRPLPEFPVRARDSRLAAGQPPVVYGAVVPLWIDVKVPAQAPPGTYTGSVAVTMAGEQPVSVPVEVKVLPWTLPDPQDYRTWIELIQSPDTLALEYDVPLWSDDHWKLIARSFDLMRDTGTRVVHVPVISCTNLGNAESMVRWIEKGPGAPAADAEGTVHWMANGPYGWDFSVMEKYLDVAQQHLGTPKIVILQVWDLYVRTNPQKRFEKFLSRGAPQATLLDPKTGKTRNALLPKLSDPGSKATWQELIKQVRQRLARRGLEKTLMIGMFCDMGPSTEDAQFFKDIAPDLKLVQQGHGLWRNLHKIADIGYNASVWGGYRFADGLRQTNQRGEPLMETHYGWKRPTLDTVFERNHALDSYPTTRWRFMAETCVTSELRGMGRLGGDYWRPVKDNRGRRVGFVHNRFRESPWMGGNLSPANPVLAPGAEGPIATNRFIALREGIQECEARIRIEEALTDDALRARLGPELAARAQKALHERLADMWASLDNMQLHGKWGAAGSWRWVPGVAGHAWFLGMDWPARNAELFALAGEVDGKLAGK